MAASLLYTHYRLKNIYYLNNFAKILAKYVWKLSSYFSMDYFGMSAL